MFRISISILLFKAENFFASLTRVVCLFLSDCLAIIVAGLVVIRALLLKVTAVHM